eukprot:TRINITY_DN113083_c0_g1_i1.p1 TRINITY_DN113083_c0_g1~~TRINITY_DN113083_c0_g1_i1.p1  ORF type:complete len:296 (-),score=37.75 TRINITY_DN113083_c0_g1_i1:200-1087(-)
MDNGSAGNTGRGAEYWLAIFFAVWVAVFMLFGVPWMILSRIYRRSDSTEDLDVASITEAVRRTAAEATLARQEATRTRELQEQVMVEQALMREAGLDPMLAKQFSREHSRAMGRQYGVPEVVGMPQFGTGGQGLAFCGRQLSDQDLLHLAIERSRQEAQAFRGEGRALGECSDNSGASSYPLVALEEKAEAIEVIDFEEGPEAPSALRRCWESSEEAGSPGTFASGSSAAARPVLRDGTPPGTTDWSPPASRSAEALEPQFLSVHPRPMLSPRQQALGRQLRPVLKEPGDAWLDV